PFRGCQCRRHGAELLTTEGGLDRRKELALLKSDMGGEQLSQRTLRLRRRRVPLELQRPEANLGVLTKDSCDARIFSPAGVCEAWQQHLLLDSEVELSMAVPELEEGSSRGNRILVVHVLQPLGDHQRLMVIAREALKIGVAFHFTGS